MAASWAYEEVVLDVDPGAKVVLYTDGLIDRRDIALEEGLERLLAAADRDPGRPVEAVCRELITRVGPERGGRRHRLLAMERLRVRDEAFRFRMPAEPAELARMRRALGGWLRGIGVEPEDAHDLVLACAEACSNAIRHAYGPSAGTVDVEARTGERRRRGRGPRLRAVARTAAARRAAAGLALIEALAPSMRIERSGSGHRRDDAEDPPRLGLGVTELPNVTIAAEDGVVVASLTGEIDLSNATEITDALLGGVPNEALGLVIDLSDVSYLDSAGVRMLAELDHRLGWRAQVAAGRRAGDVAHPAGARDRGSGAGALARDVRRCRSNERRGLGPGTRTDRRDEPGSLEGSPARSTLDRARPRSSVERAAVS